MEAVRVDAAALRARAVRLRADSAFLREEALESRERANVLLDHVAESILEIDAWPPRSQHLRLRLPRHPVSVSLARHALRRWLEELDLEPGEVDDLTLALSEACANAVEHAHGTRREAVEVEVRMEAAELLLTVRDYGQWREEREGSTERGRGLDLMRSVLDSVEVARGADGTFMTLHKRLCA